MKLAIYSLFRDDNPIYIKQYFDRLDTQKTNIDFLCYLVEGDSESALTYETLIAYSNYHSFSSMVLTTTTGLPRHGQDTTDERFRCLSQTANIALDAIAKDNWATHIMLIESDLKYNHHLIQDLVNNIPDKNSGIAPMIMAGESFYDIWGFRKLDGESVGPFFTTDELYPLSSFGSCFILPIQPIYDGLRFDLRCNVGLSNDYVERGYDLWVTPQARVYQI